MGSARKTMTCECGGKYQEVEKEFDGIKCPVMACPKCDDVVFTIEQSKHYHSLKKIEEIRREIRKTRKRKISKLGNSMGILLPTQLKELGFDIGRDFDIQLVDENTIIIVLAGLGMTGRDHKLKIA
jgi:hypothetical protein